MARYPCLKPSHLLWLPVALAAALGGALTVAQDAGTPPAPAPADGAGAAAAEPLFFIARETWPEGREVGLVTLGPWEVMRIPATLGGLSPYERAMIAAKRLNDFIDDYGQTGAVHRVTIEGYEVVQGGNINIITADPDSARDQGVSPGTLADRWCDAILRTLALGGHQVASEPKDEGPPGGYRPLPDATALVGASPAPPVRPAEQAPAMTAPPEVAGATTPAPGAGGAIAAADSIVPLTDRDAHMIGRAVVRGAPDGVARVKRVVQLSRKQGRAELRALIPCSSEVGRGRIERVPGVYIAGLANGTPEGGH